MGIDATDQADGLPLIVLDKPGEADHVDRHDGN
jgi:hypothetical protein